MQAVLHITLVLLVMQDRQRVGREPLPRRGEAEAAFYAKLENTAVAA